MSLNGYTIRLVNGANNLRLSNHHHSEWCHARAGQYYVICGDNSVVTGCQLDVSPNSDLIQNGSPDALSLLLNGTVVDSLSYEGSVPGNTEGTSVSTANGETNSAPNLSPLTLSERFRLQRQRDRLQGRDPYPRRRETPAARAAAVRSVCAAIWRHASRPCRANGRRAHSSGPGSISRAWWSRTYQDDNLNGFFVQERDSRLDGGSDHIRRDLRVRGRQRRAGVGRPARASSRGGQRARRPDRAQ